MRRRTLLATVAATLGVAGCSGSGGSPTTSTASPTDTETATATPTPTRTETPTPTATRTPIPDPDLAVRVRYAGEWQGSVLAGQRQRSVDGTGERTIDVADDVNVVSANAQKQDDTPRTLTIQILRDGEVVIQSSTTAEYGIAQVSESFY